MYLIEVDQSRTFRPATADEVKGIDRHRDDYPGCDGSQIRDDGSYTTARMNKRLRCVDCRKWVVLPTPLF